MIAIVVAKSAAIHKKGEKNDANTSLQSKENFQRLIPSFINKRISFKKARRNTAPPVARNNMKQDLRPSTANN